MKAYAPITAAVFLAVLFAANCYRAATQSVVHDEALTWQLYLAGPISPIFDFYDANHHFLATLLERISTGVLGTSELTLRLPTLLAGILYFSTVFRLSLFVFGEGPLFLLSVALLSAHPLVLDFLVAARGYGLALAFFLYALFEALRIISGGPEIRSRRNLFKVAAGLSLAVASNLTLVAPAFVFALLFLLVLRARARPAPARQGRGRRQEGVAAGEGFFVLCVAGFAFLFFLSAPISNASSENFYAGVSSLWGSLCNLVQVSFAHNAGVFGINAGLPVWWLRFLAVFLPASAVAALALGGRRPWASARKSGLLLFLSAGTMVGSMALLIALHHAVGFPYPADRTGLYFLPLLWLCLASMVSVLANGAGARRTAGLVYAGLLALFSAHFLIQWNTGSFFVWRYDADSRAILEKMQALRGAAGAPLRAGISWPLEPSMNFYRAVRNWTWLAPFTRQGPDGEYPVYVLVTGDQALIQAKSLRLLYRGPASNTVLALPPAP